MQLTTPRLLIRSPKMEDMTSSFAIWGDLKVRQYSGGGVATEAEIRKGFLADLKLADNHYGFRTVIELSSGKHIGDCGLLQKEIESQSEVELVYFFNSAYWGQGFATEAATALLAYGFTDLGLKRLVSLIHPENKGSKAVASKIGMKFEKTVVTSSGSVREMFSQSRERYGK